jgi:hypothetical protein
VLAVVVAETPSPTPGDPRGEAMVADKLEADHASVSDLLGEVEAAARELSDAADPAARTRLTHALQQLSADLLTHLRYEEDHISDTLRTWSDWPFG